MASTDTKSKGNRSSTFHEIIEFGDENYILGIQSSHTVD